MTYSIDTFRATIGKYGVAKPSNFAVNITAPQGLSLPIVGDLPLLAESVNFPGTSLGLEEVRMRGYGLTEKRPSSIAMDDITITFIGDAQGQIINFFTQWQNMIYNVQPGTFKNITRERFNYPVNYRTPLEVYGYDIASQRYIRYKMLDAFPYVVGNVQLGWELTDAFVRFPVTFSYGTFTTETLEELTNTQTSPANQTGSSNRNVAIIEKMVTSSYIPEYLTRNQAV